MIALGHLRPIPKLLSQLEGWLEEVHEQTNRSIEPAQSRRSLKALIAPVAHDAPNNSAVLLLHPGLVVLAIRPAACELNANLLAVRLHGLVQEHAVIIRVEPEQRERHSFANLAQHL